MRGAFNYHARRVRDPGHPPWRRLSSLRACVRSYCRLSGGRYDEVSERLGVKFDHDPRRQPPDDLFLRRTLDEVERARNRHLERLRAFERRRAIAKSRGNRQLSGADHAALREVRGGAG